jgi:hypothetical protein
MLAATIVAAATPARTITCILLSLPCPIDASGTAFRFAIKNVSFSIPVQGFPAVGGRGKCARKRALQGCVHLPARCRQPLGITKK